MLIEEPELTDLPTQEVGMVLEEKDSPLPSLVVESPQKLYSCRTRGRTGRRSHRYRWTSARV